MTHGAGFVQPQVVPWRDEYGVPIEKDEPMRSLLTTIVTVLLLSFVAWAETPVAMVTKLKGKATLQGQPLQLLSYLNSDDKAQVSAGSEVVFSYIEGGVRATVNGPCTVRFTPEGPLLTSGKPEQLKLKRPARRVGSTLPSHLDLGTGGHLRRGELSLHLSGKLLPGEQEIEISALPSFQFFYLTVSNSSTFEDVFEAEVSSHTLKLPAGILKAGQSYDFLLEGTTTSGTTQELKKDGVVVLSEDVVERIRESEKQVDPSDFESRVELLAVYLKHGLDRQSLKCVDSLLSTTGANSRLLEIRKLLRHRLNYSGS